MSLATPTSPEELDTDAGIRFDLKRLVLRPAMVHSTDARGHLTSVNDAWLAGLGYAREEVLGRALSDFLIPASRHDGACAGMPDDFSTDDGESVACQMMCRDGGVLDVLLSVFVDRYAVGGGRTTHTVVTDVTALMRRQRELAASEARYRILVEQQSELVSLASPDGHLHYVNPAYAAFHGRDPDDMIGRNLFEFVPKRDQAALAHHLGRVVASRQGLVGENRVTLPDGRQRWMAWTNRALTDGNGCVTAIHSVGRDIDERVLAEQRLKESEIRYRLLADNSSDMVFQLDSELVRRYVSPACRELLGYEPEQMIGVKPLSMAHPDDAERLGLVFNSLLNGDAVSQSIINRIRHRDGRWIWVEARLRALITEEAGTPTGIIGALRDISARKAIEDELAEANRRLQILAEQDSLTGLANRRAFDETLTKEHLRARRDRTPLALILIDVDKFKNFNDRYGHPAGDECLRRVASAIACSIRRPGDLAARYGGEEFVVLLPNTDADSAMLMGERIRQAVLRLGIPHEASPHQQVTVSAGVACHAEDAAETPDRLLQNADRALYGAKDAGSNAVLRATAPQPGAGAHSPAAA